MCMYVYVQINNIYIVYKWYGSETIKQVLSSYEGSRIMQPISASPLNSNFKTNK